MLLQFKKTNDNPQKLDKSFENVGNAVNAIPLESCSVIAPVFTLKYDSSYHSATHITVAAFENRTYFITDIVLNTGGKCTVYTTIDVLSTYATQIKNCQGTILRAEKPKSNLIHDSKFPLIAKMGMVQTFFDDTPFSAANGWNYVLTVAGKEGVVGND